MIHSWKFLKIYKFSISEVVFTFIIPHRPESQSENITNIQSEKQAPLITENL